MKALYFVQGRVARPASARRNIAKTLVQSQIMWCIFFYLLPWRLYRLEEALGLSRYRVKSPAYGKAGVVLFLAGGTFAYISAGFMVVKGQGTPLPADCPRELVIAGPYLYVRNPMAMGSFAQGGAVGLFAGSPLILLYVVAGAVGWNYLVRPWEENDLERRFGAPYVRYRDNVRCWIPGLKPYHDPGGQGTRGNAS